MSGKVYYVDCSSQVDGNAFLEVIDGDGVRSGTVMIRRDETQGVLSSILNAIRIEGDTEKMTLAAKTCMAMLGVARFQR